MSGRDRFENDHARNESVVRSLIEDGTLEPVAARDDDAQLWMDCDLCSFVENRLHERVEPEGLAIGERAAWLRRALATGETLMDPRRSSFVAAYWLVERGVRAGTLALPRFTLGHHFLQIFSLYVFPARRSGGVAYRALRGVYEAALAAGYAGIRVATYWTWQAAVRRYLLRYGMWTRSFKRSIEFVWASDLPSHAITVGDRTARFEVAHGARTLELITASREGDLLGWNELPAMTSGELEGEVVFHARSTFAVALAVHGWPLLRAGDDLGEAGIYDIGGPDVLAYKIAMFEFFDRQSGFDVRVPHIPGLPYEAIARQLAG
jgi:hypothetical protein